VESCRARCYSDELHVLFSGRVEQNVALHNVKRARAERLRVAEIGLLSEAPTHGRDQSPRTIAQALRVIEIDLMARDVSHRERELNRRRCADIS
jgi:hypothetical protein